MYNILPVFYYAASVADGQSYPVIEDAKTHSL